MVEKIEEAYGSFKIFWHPDKLKSFLEEKIIAPIYVRVKPTNRCNHKCIYCAYDPDVKYILSEMFHRNDEIPREKMHEILESFQEIGVKAITYSGGGEPLIYPYIEETLEETLKKNIDLSIITNGQALTGRKADLLANSKWVRISLDSSNPQTFSKIRRVKESYFSELITNIENFAKKKKNDCEFGINFVVSQDNSDDVYQSSKFFKELGVNHVKITPVWLQDQFFEYHLSIKEKVLNQIKMAKKDLDEENFKIFDTYENDFERTGVCERDYSQCFMMQTVPVIGADCNVYFCHDKAYAKDGILGSIKDKSFKELWFSPESEKKFKNFNPQKGCKHHCTGDLRNKLIHTSLNCSGRHINFI